MGVARRERVAVPGVGVQRCLTAQSRQCRHVTLFQKQQHGLFVVALNQDFPAAVKGQDLLHAVKRVRAAIDGVSRKTTRSEGCIGSFASISRSASASP